MRKAVFVGDLHVQMSNLKDTERLFEFIAQTAKKNCASDVVFLGDIYHNHAVLRQEVIAVVQEGFKKIHSSYNSIPNDMPIWVVVGNHDGSNPHSIKVNAVRQTLDNLCTVVDEKAVDLYPFTMVGFSSTQEEFVRKLNPNRSDWILVCHQTFDGARYENGFYAPDGLSMDVVPNPLVISGHIHTAQSVGKVLYLGTPRPVNFGEAINLNDPPESREDKAIFIVEDTGGFQVSIKAISTSGLVKKYYTLSLSEGEDLPTPESIKAQISGPESELRISASGSGTFYDTIVAAYAGVAPKVEFIPVIIRHVESQLKTTTLKEFDTYDALQEYVFDVYNDSQENKEKVWQRLQAVMPNLGKRSFS